MFSRAPVITDSGMTLLVRAASGEQITFTKLQVGSGVLSGSETERNMTALKNAVLTNIAITEAVGTGESGYVQLTGSFNNQTDVQEAFRWTELGLIAEDEDGVEYLYAYGYDNENAEVISASGSSVIIEQNISVIIAIGESENITANVIPQASYASRQEFLAHTADTGNPHQVTAAQVGAAPTSHTHAASQIASGTLPIARGGTGVNSASALSNLVNGYVSGSYASSAALQSHTGNTSNPHQVTAAQVGAAPASHTHAAADIASGTLPVSRGGTGVNSEAALTSLIQQMIGGGDFVIGQYTGNNALRQNISLGFQPTVVFGFAPPPYDSYSSGVQLLGFTWRCAAGANYVAQADTTPEGYTCSADELFAKNHGGAAITSDGFAVGYAEGYCQAANTNRRYLYVAFRT